MSIFDDAYSPRDLKVENSVSYDFDIIKIGQGISNICKIGSDAYDSLNTKIKNLTFENEKLSCRIEELEKQMKSLMNGVRTVLINNEDE